MQMQQLEIPNLLHLLDCPGQDTGPPVLKWRRQFGLQEGHRCSTWSTSSKSDAPPTRGSLYFPDASPDVPVQGHCHLHCLSDPSPCRPSSAPGGPPNQTIRCKDVTAAHPCSRPLFLDVPDPHRLFSMTGPTTTMRRAIVACCSALAALSVSTAALEVDKQQLHAHIQHENRVGKDWNYVRRPPHL